MQVRESQMADRNVLKGHITWSDYTVPGVFVKPYSKSFTLNEAWITTQSVRRFCFGLAKPSILHAGLFGREVSELVHVETHSWSSWGDADERATAALSAYELLLQSLHPTLPLIHILLLLTHSLHVNLLTFICTISLCSVC